MDWGSLSPAVLRGKSLCKMSDKRHGNALQEKLEELSHGDVLALLLAAQLSAQHLLHPGIASMLRRGQAGHQGAWRGQGLGRDAEWQHPAAAIAMHLMGIQGGPTPPSQ